MDGGNQRYLRDQLGSMKRRYTVQRYGIDVFSKCVVD
jgi:hypothetical protein